MSAAATPQPDIPRPNRSHGQVTRRSLERVARREPAGGEAIVTSVTWTPASTSLTLLLAVALTASDITCE